MNRIETVFVKEKKVFIPFVTAGDPSLEMTEALILALAQEGVKLIEIGLPFSDPIAEGPVIQAADNRALSKGCTIDAIFVMLKRVRECTDIPIVFLTYINPIFVYGRDKFFAKAQEVGVDGVIVPDVPFEERNIIAQEAAKYDITLISLIAPTSETRIQMIAQEAKGYIYLVSSLGVTGMRQNITTDIAAIVKKIRDVTATPVTVGFGIATPEQAEAMARLSDGAIVGSAIVKIIGTYGDSCLEPVIKYVKAMLAAVAKAAKC